MSAQERKELAAWLHNEIVKYDALIAGQPLPGSKKRRITGVAPRVLAAWERGRAYHAELLAQLEGVTDGA